MHCWKFWMYKVLMSFCRTRGWKDLWWYELRLLFCSWSHYDSALFCTARGKENLPSSDQQTLLGVLGWTSRIPISIGLKSHLGGTG